MLKKFFVYLIAIFICIGSLGVNEANKVYAKEVTKSEEGTNGTWIWDTSIIVSQGSEIISFLKESNINELYLQINRDISKDKYREFINMASENDIKVYALDGSSSWILEEKRYRVDRFFDWVEEYNNTSSNNQKFSGIHLDVEPYVSSIWKSDKATAILYYQDYLEYAVDRAHKLNLSFGADIPFWFDGTYFSNIYGEGNLARWLLERVDSANIMAYRDKAENIISCAKNELKWAKELGKKLVISVEIGKSSEGDSITFYEEGKDYMYSELEKVKQYCKEEGYTPNLAIHYLEKLMEFK